MMKLEGDLQEIELVPHLLELADERFTGAIRFENDGIIKILYFKDGDVLSASTNDRTDSVDEILLRAGKVNRDHVRQALGKRKDNETLGDALLSMGFITRKELTWGRRTQIVGILRSVAAWTSGSFQIVRDYLPNREEGTLFHLPQIVLELAVTESDKAGIEQRIDGGDAVFARLADFKERYARLALNEDADAIAEQIDGERSAAEIAAVSKLDAFAVYKLLLALESLSMVRRAKPEVLHEVHVPSMAAPPPPAILSDESYELPSSPAEEPPPMQRPIGAGVEERGVEEPPADPAWSAPDLGALPPVEETPAERYAATPIEEPPRTRRSAMPLLLILLVIGLLAAAAWGGWAWWSGRAPADPSGPAGAQTPTEGMAAPSIVPPETAATAPVETVEVTPPSAVSPPPPSAAPPAAASDPRRARYQEMAEAFAREGRGVAYTVQFELVCQTDSVGRALDAGSNVWFVPIQYRGEPCFRVFWGRYETREAAERARDEIPRSLRGSGPVIVRPRELLR